MKKSRSIEIKSGIDEFTKTQFFKENIPKGLK
jgi:hypothetical protein